MTKNFIIPLLVLMAASAVGYRLGYSRAEAEGHAARNLLLVEREEERRERADAYGKALAGALSRYEDEVLRGQKLEQDLSAEQTRHAKEAAKLQRKIADVTRNSTHTFSTDFVLLYNEAIGLSGDALSEALCAFGADGASGTCGPLVPGLLEPFSGVSEADLLGHISKYGKRCRNLETQLSVWQALETGEQ